MPPLHKLLVLSQWPLQNSQGQTCTIRQSTLRTPSSPPFVQVDRHFLLKCWKFSWKGSNFQMKLLRIADALPAKGTQSSGWKGRPRQPYWCHNHQGSILQASWSNTMRYLMLTGWFNWEAVPIPNVCAPSLLGRPSGASVSSSSRSSGICICQSSSPNFTHWCLRIS